MHERIAEAGCLTYVHVDGHNGPDLGIIRIRIKILAQRKKTYRNIWGV